MADREPGGPAPPERAFRDRGPRWGHPRPRSALRHGQPVAGCGPRSDPRRPSEDAARTVRHSGKALTDVDLTGSEAPARWSANLWPLREDGAVVGIGAVVIDQTARRTVEDALRKSEAQFRAICNAFAGRHLPLHAGRVEPSTRTPRTSRCSASRSRRATAPAGRAPFIRRTSPGSAPRITAPRSAASSTAETSATSIATERSSARAW